MGGCAVATARREQITREHARKRAGGRVRARNPGTSCTSPVRAQILEATNARFLADGCESGREGLSAVQTGG